MSLEKDNLDIANLGTKKSRGRSILNGLKIGIAVILLFLFIVGLTFGILYFTNKNANKIINNEISKYKADQELKKASQAQGLGDKRVSELANYYLTMSNEDAANKLIEIKAKDKKSYEKIASSMNLINPRKSDEINAIIKKMTSKNDVIKSEYEAMQTELAKQGMDASTHYTSLGVRGAIDAISNELQQTMDYDKVANALGASQATFVARVLHYINPIYIDGIKNRLNPDFLREVEKQQEVYTEFLRKNVSQAKVYGNSEPKLAAASLQDIKKFKDEDLAVIFSNMNYLSAAKILNSFEDEKRMQSVLSAIKNVEDYQINFDGSLSTVIASSIKILKNYNNDVDILKRAYEKMDSASLAAVIDALVNQNPTYKEYIIDPTRKFTISEEDMAVEAMKRMKPNLVAGVISELKNQNKVDKAAYLSRQIGIPEPNRTGGN